MAAEGVETGRGEASPAMPVPAGVLPDLLEARTREEPRAVALVVDGGPTLTYEEWERRSRAVAHGLADRGVGRGDRVALVFDNARWTDYAAAYLGTLRAGAVAVPLSPRLAPPEVAHVLAHCRAGLLVSPPDLAPRAAPCPVTTPDALEGSHPGGPAPLDVAPGDLAEILYTSGTTGVPKGVACSHANLMAHDLPPEGDDHRRASFVHAFPLGTNAGQEVLRLPLRRGDRTAVVLPTFDPDRLCALVAEHRVRRLQLVPATARVLLDSGALERHDVASLERVTLSSAPSPPALFACLAEALPHVSLWNAYALTEAGPARTLARYDPARPGSVGRPVGHTRVRVAAPGSGAEAPPGETGEIWLRRDGAPSRSYWDDPAATAATFVDGWVRTGDLGYLDGAGELHLVDRASDRIISGGANVSSVEVEAVLGEHPAVAEAAVVGVPHPVLGEDVAAAVVARSPTTVAELQAFVRARLAEHKVPHHLAFVEDLPRNASGKVRKQEVRDRLAPPSGPAAARPTADAARTPVEERICAIWEAVLGVEHVAVDDDFYERGGHSLAATQIVARVRDAFDVDLGVTAVFEAPTVAELAAMVTAQVDEPSAAP